MKMRTDVLWEPDKTDEHDRLLSRFEDDIIGLRGRGRLAGRHDMAQKRHP